MPVTSLRMPFARPPEVAKIKIKIKIKINSQIKSCAGGLDGAKPKKALLLLLLFAFASKRAVAQALQIATSGG
ncbi:hypothetical protein [Pseudomonas juntendi]|uniref:hypothetical protein n=1 Tax=Pseudomonas juntendi TaxID=2666183 RepID=UPI00279D62BB|nr:hypothetical protein [Pseudomonas juntendi]MDV5386273.1 hypothetical protein [Pseudomonas juntendi]WHL28205.1 hypothetical protein QJS63_00475 [Pseudomonas juntendi]